MPSLPLLIDWDDTLVYWRDGKEGEWVEGAREFLTFSRRQRWNPTVFSSRANYAEGLTQIRSILDAAKFGDVPILPKPLGFAYVDNRAAEFRGSWKETREKVRLFAKT